jgi:hypothetical protein
MATAEVGIYFSSPTARQGFVRSGTAEGSLGGFCTTTPVGETLFPDIDGQSNAEGVEDFRCVFVRNGTNFTLESATVSVADTVAQIGLAADSIPASDQGAQVPQAGRTPPTNFSKAIKLGDIPPRGVRGLWVRRRLRNANPARDGMALKVRGELVG